MCHSRWTTTASRVCRLYISTEEPQQELKLITQYVLRVYASLSLEIRRHPSCLMGARHFHTQMRSSRFLVELLPKIKMEEINKCIQRNSFFAHPENILIAMCDDDRQPIRELAYRRILDGRKVLRQRSSSEVRQYTVPPLNMTSTDYVDMINWQKVGAEHLAPPLLRDLIILDSNVRDLAAFKISDPNFTGKMYANTITNEMRRFDLDLRGIPCHSQAVERCVKVVTEASNHVSNESSREGYIIAKLISRAKMPLFLSKNRFPLQNSAVKPKL